MESVVEVEVAATVDAEVLAVELPASCRRKTCSSISRVSWVVVNFKTD